MTTELLVVIIYCTIISLIIIALNFRVLYLLCERYEFKDNIPTFIKVILLLPPLGIIFYLIVEFLNFLDDFLKKR